MIIASYNIITVSSKNYMIFAKTVNKQNWLISYPYYTHMHIKNIATHYNKLYVLVE